MSEATHIKYWDMDDDALKPLLVGRRVVEASTKTATLTLDNGVRLKFDESNSSCCSEINLTGLFAADHLITDVRVGDNEEQTGGEGGYKAWIQVITEAGPLSIAEADGDASNGYYLHGFALGVQVLPPVAPSEAVQPS